MPAPAHTPHRSLLRVLAAHRVALLALLAALGLCCGAPGCAVNPVPTPEKSTDGKNNDASSGFATDSAEADDAAGATADAAGVPADATETGVDGGADGEADAPLGSDDAGG